MQMKVPLLQHFYTTKFKDIYIAFLKWKYRQKLYNSRQNTQETRYINSKGQDKQSRNKLQ